MYLRRSSGASEAKTEPALLAIDTPQYPRIYDGSYLILYHFLAGLDYRESSHIASASPIGVEGGPLRKGQISSAIRRQLAVAFRLPRTAYRPRLMRCMITYSRGTSEYGASGPRASKKRRTMADAYAGVIVIGASCSTVP